MEEIKEETEPKKKKAEDEKTPESVFDAGHPVSRFMSRLGTFIIANLLFLLGCLPIITIGVSISALNKVMIEFEKADDISVSRIYFKAFKENLLCGIIGFILGAGFLSMGIFGAIASLYAESDTVMLAGLAVCGILTLLSLCFISFYFGVIARYENNIASHVKNSLIIGFVYIIWSFIIIALWIMAVGFFVMIPELLIYAGFIWLVCGFSFMFYLTNKIQSRVFRLIRNKERKDDYL